MPETPIYKNRDLGIWKNEIGLSKQGVSSAPPGNPVLAQYRDQVPFCRFVPRGSDLRHDPGTFLLTKRVHTNRQI